MKFSNETIGVLKNFSMINPGLVFKPGSVIRTMNPQKTVMASAKVSESIEQVARVYDLSRFLATLSLFDDPDVEFTEDKFIVSSGKSTVSYTYAAAEMVVSPPEKDINFPEPEAVVTVKWKDLDSVIKASGVLKLSEIAFTSDGTNISLSAVDVKNPTADSYSVTIAENTGSAVFRMIIKVENLKLMPNDYQVSLSSKGLTHFKSSKAEYYIALEATK
jgi:hypothetical protein